MLEPETPPQRNYPGRHWPQWQLLCFAVAVFSSMTTAILWHRPGIGSMISSAVTVTSSGAALATLAYRVRFESTNTGHPWYKTASFIRVVRSILLYVVFVAAIAFAMLAAKVVQPYSYTQIMPGIVELLVVALTVTRIIIVNRLLRTGRELPNGDHALSDLAAWSERHLGRWWTVETVLISLFCLAPAIANAPLLQSWSFGALFIAGQFCFRAVAQDRGMHWAGQEAQKSKTRRKRALEHDPAFQAMKARNGWIERGSLATLMVSAAAAFTPLWPFHIYDDHDWRIACLVFLGLALAVTSPAVFAALATWPCGRERWIEYREYWSIKENDPGCRKSQWIVLASITTAAICVVALATSAGRS